MARISAKNDPFAAEIEREIAYRNSPAFILKSRASAIVRAKDADIKDSEIANMAIKSLPVLANAKPGEVLEAVRDILRSAEEERRQQVTDLVLTHGAKYADSADVERPYPWLKSSSKDEIAKAVQGLDYEETADLLGALTDFANKSNGAKKAQAK